ncbi:MAG: hypothetical protein KAR38_03270 [Calditrichia bacterium]|nr:hypothetical protein [Calditrichia bacterium]
MDFSLTGFAEIAAQILDDNNIPHLIQKDPILTAYSISGSNIGNIIKILVPVEYEEEAAQLLSHLNSIE